MGGSRSLQGDSPYGAKDMAGNVSEMVVDAWNPDFYEDSPAVDPVDTDVEERGLTVTRGGGVGGSLDIFFTTTNRETVYVPAPGIPANGFRCARSP